MLFVKSLIKFAHAGNFTKGVSANKSNKRGNKFITTNEMVKYPRFILSMPKLSPFSKKFKDSILDTSDIIDTENFDAKEEEKMGMKYLINFHQAKEIQQYLQIAFKRDNLPVLNFDDDSDLNKVGRYGARFLLVGTDDTVFNFMQEYVPAMLQLNLAKNMQLRRNVKIYLLPDE